MLNRLKQFTLAAAVALALGATALGGTGAQAAPQVLVARTPLYPSCEMAFPFSHRVHACELSS